MLYSYATQHKTFENRLTGMLDNRRLKKISGITNSDCISENGVPDSLGKLHTLPSPQPPV